ncbi:MAG TPA: hypothetical protein ENJ37_08820 [Deltaproteobacteria bacterium]|nr:hypothetical protein [Deltaproteobacteria bacterium]
MTNQDGMISRSTLLWLLVLSSLFYVGSVVVPPYVSYRMLSYDVESEAEMAHLYSDARLAEHIMEKAGTWNVPLTRKGIIIKRDKREITLYIRYDVRHVFFGGYVWNHTYHIYVTRPLKKTARDELP